MGLRVGTKYGRFWSMARTLASGWWEHPGIAAPDEALNCNPILMIKKYFMLL